MALLLGIYKKNEVTDAALEASLLNIFTLRGQREVKTVGSGAMKIWLTENTGGFSCFESENF